MKFSILPLLIAGAGIAQHVSASPIRVVVTEISNIRLGHAVANVNDNSNVAHTFPTAIMGNQVDDAGRHKKHRPCPGGMRAKAIAISNAFRKALGLPLIEAHARPPMDGEKEVHGGLVRIMPFIGTPVDDQGDMKKDPHPHHHHKHHKSSFLRRISHALMSLGPWEGRVVAFVIGCGIGVLLRMIWVMGIITYRMIRGERNEESHYTTIVFEQATDEYVAPPPQYIDEKVEAIDNKPASA
jgi:hypothetical protein